MAIQTKNSTRPGPFRDLGGSCLERGGYNIHRLTNLSGALEPPVIVGNVSVALVVVAERRLSPATVFLLATGLERIAVGADVLAALGIRTARPVVVSTISILVAVAISAAICILIMISILAVISVLVTIAILVAISITPLVRSAVSIALKVPIDVLDFSTATLKISKFGRLAAAMAVVTGSM